LTTLRASAQAPRVAGVLVRRSFWVWLCAWYAAWLGIVFLGGHTATVAEHWPIALAMALGSYFAGSTPMGGGTIGFPVLVLVLGESASLGRDFSLAVQSIGMTSAAIFILSSRRPVEWRLLGWTLLGVTAATPIAAALVAGRVSDVWLKMIFAVIWCSFGVMHFVKMREIVAREGVTRTTTGLDREIGLAVGVVGGVLAAIVGVGVDMVLYAVLVLLYRADLKVAIPTSVVAMAYASIVGFVSHAALGTLNPAIFGHWIAAAPVVAVGAPFGALVVHFLPRTPTLVIVSALCVVQYVWMLARTKPEGWALAFALGGLVVFNLAFHVMYVRGRALHERLGEMELDELAR
jgi:uncharacterized membrane protein YfcA